MLRPVVRKRLGWAFLAAYLVSYVVLSSAGTYETGNQGGRDWRRSWCPRYLAEPYTAPTGRAKIGITALGVLYLPCMLIDTWFWHRDQPVDI